MLNKSIKILSVVLLSVFLVSCSNKTKTEDEYLSTAKTLYDSAKAKNDNTLFNESIVTYKEFIKSYPKSEKVLGAYTQIARIYNENLTNYQEAINYYKEIADKFPNTKDAKQSLFLVAFTYDEALKDKENAKASYKKFLEKYPEDTDANEKLSESAKVMLQSLESGNSIEDMIKNIESKSAGDKKDVQKKDEPKKDDTKKVEPQKIKDENKVQDKVEKKDEKK